MGSLNFMCLSLRALVVELSRKSCMSSHQNDVATLGARIVAVGPLFKNTVFA
jgi:hypothetical protein